MKKWLYLSLVIVPLLVLGTVFSVSAQDDQPPVYCTNTPEHCQVKVAQVPIPWQFWAIDADGNVIDRIRISPTWLNPPSGQPRGFEEPVLIQRQVALTTAPVKLEELLWTENGPVPGLPDLEWQQEDDEPIEIEDGYPTTLPEDLVLEITPASDDMAVLVAYEVMKETDAGAVPQVIGRFINEAILSPQVAGELREIVEIRTNFNVHNETDFGVTNFELDFLGLDFKCENIVEALGFVVGEPDKPWGANEENPLIVRPIEVALADGTEVKWVQPDRPLENCEWLHLGLAFGINLPDVVNDNPVTVQGYWTIIVPCEGRMTGGGSVFSKDYGRVTHGFELHCNASDDPNNLEVNWRGGRKGANRFHLTDLIWSWCRDNPSIDERPPLAGFDTYIGFGIGRLNGVDGATVGFVFTDEGEPGKDDKAAIMIWDADGNLVFEVKGSLKNGNHQAHPN